MWSKWDKQAHPISEREMGWHHQHSSMVNWSDEDHFACNNKIAWWQQLFPQKYSDRSMRGFSQYNYGSSQNSYFKN